MSWLFQLQVTIPLPHKSQIQRPISKFPGNTARRFQWVLEGEIFIVGATQENPMLDP